MLSRMTSSIQKLQLLSRVNSAQWANAVPHQRARFHNLSRLAFGASSSHCKPCFTSNYNRHVTENHYQFSTMPANVNSSSLSTVAKEIATSRIYKAVLRRHCQFCNRTLLWSSPSLNAAASVDGLKKDERAALTEVSHHAIHTCHGALYAGHNKWSKVKYIKGPKDLEKSRVFTRIGMGIKIAVKDGGPNPETNSALASLVALAKAKAMPKVTMDGMIKKAAIAKQGDVQQTFEIRGPGNSSLLVNILTDNPRRTKMEITNLVSKNGGSLGEQGTVMFAFQKKGVLRVPCEVEGQGSMNFDDAEELAIDAGAEEVKEGTDDGGQRIFLFICDPAELRLVRDSLTQNPLPVLSSGLEFVAQTTLPLSDTDMEAAAKLINALEEHEHVVRVFDNISEE